MFSSLSLAIAFSAPELDSRRLRMAARSTIWTVALDWTIDTLAKTVEEVADVARRCRAIGNDHRPQPGDELATFLRDIRDELASQPGYTSQRSLWRDELNRLLRAEEQDWLWRSSAKRPDLDEYLANSDSIALSFVYICHLIDQGIRPSRAHLRELRQAGWAAQRVVRLNNDVASLRRDKRSGDLNALLLPGVTRATIRRRIAVETGGAIDRIAALPSDYSGLARYLERQMGFCSGLYGVADFWNSP
jgi:hypothetical protein